MIITISANSHDLCIITNCNNSVHHYLGYHKSEMIAENIAKIIPKTIGERHNQILSKAFERGQLLLTEKLILPLNKDGYVQLMTSKLRLMNNLNHGIQIIGYYYIIILIIIKAIAFLVRRRMISSCIIRIQEYYTQ